MSPARVVRVDGAAGPPGCEGARGACKSRSRSKKRADGANAAGTVPDLAALATTSAARGSRAPEAIGLLALGGTLEPMVVSYLADGETSMAISWFDWTLQSPAKHPTTGYRLSS